uniref:Uncharacterized protein n=1 Tax=Rhizophora mucronata TaxID=61149 RepID=A0A2P2JIZ4_RHIMU
MYVCNSFGRLEDSGYVWAGVTVVLVYIRFCKPMPVIRKCLWL